MKTFLAFLTLSIVAIFCAGCGPKAPDKSLVLWEQPAPGIAAIAHARDTGGTALQILPTGSMEPFLTGGDWIVVMPASKAVFENIKPADLLVYQASWLPPDSPPVCHMAAAKSGDGWIMDGIANEHRERGNQTMFREQYRGKVVQVYTKRVKK